MYQGAQLLPYKKNAMTPLCRPCAYTVSFYCTIDSLNNGIFVAYVPALQVADSTPDSAVLPVSPACVLCSYD